ncbi:MAG: hypothetical protein GXP14_00305 [Gammaproteobacteria bacterium]|nr:hypothetical protein [Gammaproteobacteria bacterium]
MEVLKISNSGVSGPPVKVSFGFLCVFRTKLVHRFRRNTHIDAQVFAEEVAKGFSLDGVDHFRSRTRYFTDSGIIGRKEFMRQFWLKLKLDEDNPDKHLTRISGLAGMFSLKRLSELS